MGNKKQIVGYVTDEEYRTVAAKAESEDRSISEWVVEATFEKIEREGLESRGQQYQIEQRLMRLVDDAADRAAEQIVEEIETAGETETSSGGTGLGNYGSS